MNNKKGSVMEMLGGTTGLIILGLIVFIIMLTIIIDRTIFIRTLFGLN